jgi:hypothetical protein
MRQSASSDFHIGSLIGTAIVLVAIAIPLMALVDYATLQDYPEWVFQSYVFNRLVAGTPSDMFSIRPYPVPYALSQLALSALLTSFSPFAASKIFVGIYLALAGLAIWQFVRQRALAPYAFVFLAVSTAIGSCFWSGYMGYQMGLVVFCVYVALPASTKTNLGMIVIFSVLLFFCHGLAFAAFCVAAGAYCLDRRRIATFLLGMVPTALLTVSYVLNNRTAGFAPGDALHIEGVANLLKYKIYTLAKLGAYQNLVFDRIDDSRLNNLIPILGLGTNLLFCLLVVAGLALGTWGALRRRALGPELLAGAILFMGFLASPPVAAGIVNPGERLLYPMLILLAPALFGAHPVVSHLLGKAMAACLAVGLCLTIYGGLAIPQKQELARAGAAPAVAGSSEAPERILFEHRLTQFDEKMRETQRAWQNEQIPALPLVFDTSLIAQTSASKFPVPR